MVNMNIGFSLFLVAVGAVLAWAVSAEVAGIDIKIVGVILMIVGLVGVALSLLFWSSIAPFARRSEVIDDRPVETRPVDDRR
jgi:small-conductance mechanosensitive channel